MNHSTQTDAAYVRAFLCGNDKLQAACYAACRRTFDRISRYLQASLDDLEDVYHESFEALWNAIDSGIIFVEGSGVKIRGIDPPQRPLNDLTGAYFAGIVRNKYLEFCRAHDRIVKIDEAEFPVSTETQPYEDVDEDIDSFKDRLTMMALNSMSRSCIEILTKFYHEGKSLSQILAERPENQSYDGLKTRKTKCLKNLKEKIITIFKANGLTPP
ncbi:MAG: hypothetical protein NC339_05815 [Muribaculaceae bacterium]|nr:hypothetical protein [Muribaculaceae bacterium]